MKKILILLLLLFSSATASAQWETLNPRPSYLDAKKMEFVNSQTGFIVNGSQLLQTTDAGTTWAIKQPLDGGNDIKFINEIGYIACDNGNVYKSTDSGETWLLLITGSTDDFFKLSVIDINTVVVASATTLRNTTDGGITWGAMPVPVNLPYEQVLNISTMYFTSALNGYIGTAELGFIYKTTNGGATWSLKVSNDTFNSGFFSMYFVNQNLGFVSQDSEQRKLYKTTDGGETWNTVLLELSVNGTVGLIHDIVFINSSTGYACGEANWVYKTTNGGSTWTRLAMPDNNLLNPPPLYGICALNNAVYIAGAGGAIYKSDNNGNSFNRYSPTYEEITRITFADTATAYAVNVNGDFIKSVNSGNSWQVVSSLNQLNYYSALQFVNASTGYCIVGNALEKTTDGALSWITSTFPGNPRTMAFIDENTGIISGNYYENNNAPPHWRTWKTSDGGTTWQIINDIYFQKIQFLNSGIGYALGPLGTVAGFYKTSDSGTTWTVITGSENGATDFYFTDENTGYYGGSFGAKGKTTDGGTTWQEMPTLPYMHINTISFGDENNGYVLNSNNEIYKTSDGGENWTYDTTINGSHDIICYGLNVYLAGTGGKILRQPSGVPLSTPQLTAKAESLYVYPNPASTSFTLSTGGVAITSIQLYDIAGRLLTPKDISFTNGQAAVTLPESANGIYAANVVLANGSRLSKKIVVN